MKLLRRPRGDTAAAGRFKESDSRGYMGRGGGGWRYMANPTFLRGTSNMVAWLFPWPLGSGVPVHGVPLGKVTRKVAGRRRGSLGSALGCDPWSWYRAKLISNPSAFILGLPGLGKSTLLRRWILGLDYFGVTSLVLGDLKGEHVKLIQALGGQVIRVGRGVGSINVLDMGSAPAAVVRLRAAGFDQEANQLLSVARGRRQAAVETLLTLQRGRPLDDREIAAIAAGLEELDVKIQGRVPIIEDLWDVLESPTTGLHAAVQSHGDMTRYLSLVDALLANLRSLAHGHGLGEVFSQESTVKFDVYRHAVFDVSGLDDTDEALRAAALMLCWGIGFGEVATANTLAAVKLAEQRQWHIVLDELWRALRAGPGLPQRVDSLIRLNRDKGVATSFASHTMDDLAALKDEADRKAAAGILERCGMVVAFGCAASEMPRLQAAVKLTQVEMDTLTSWTTPPTLNPNSHINEPWPGRGLCLVKIGARPGVPVKIELTPREEQYNDTAVKWAHGGAAA